MQLQFLGTGAGMPSKERNTSSVVLELYEERGMAWMFDCGEATQHQMLHTTIKPRKIEKIFITHLHGDHIYGLPGFISSRSFLAGEAPLTIYGPKGIKQWLQLTLSISQTHLKYPLIIEEIEPGINGIIYEDDQFCVIAQLLEHIVPCYGFRIEQKSLKGELLIEKATSLGVPKGPLLRDLKNGQDVTLENGQVIYSSDVVGPPKEGVILSILGDTKFCEQAIQLSKNADVIVHEATFDGATEQLAAQYGHSTNIEAATVAKQAGAKALILNHISARFLEHDVEKLLNEAKAVFPNTKLAKDFKVFDLKKLN